MSSDDIVRDLANYELTYFGDYIKVDELRRLIERAKEQVKEREDD